MAFEDFNTYGWLKSAKKKRKHAHRLYIQYSLDEVSIDKELNRIDSRRFLYLETLKAPVQSIIRSSFEPISAVLDSIGTENMLTIVIGETSTSELSYISSMYTKPLFRNLPEFPKDMHHFYHKYRNRSIKQLIKSKNSFTLVLGVMICSLSYNKLVSFCGPPEGSTRFTLRLQFRKSELLHRSTNMGVKTFYFGFKPYACTIMGKGGLHVHHQSYPNGKPTIEFIIKGNNFAQLEQMYGSSRNIDFPMQWLMCRTFIVSASKDCIEQLEDTTSATIYAIDCRTWERKIVPCILYGLSALDCYNPRFD